MSVDKHRAEMKMSCKERASECEDSFALRAETLLRSRGVVSMKGVSFIARNLQVSLQSIVAEAGLSACRHQERWLGSEEPKPNFISSYAIFLSPPASVAILRAFLFCPPLTSASPRVSLFMKSAGQAEPR